MRAIVLALTAALAAGSAHAGDVTDPVWAKAPDRSDWARAYPAAAARAGISGAVKMRCAADSAGLLQNCAVVEEAPLGQGFGAAALSLASGMELRAKAMDGRPVAGRDLIVPVRFEPQLLHPGTVITNPDWMRQPTNDELLQYYPARATSDGAKVRLVCVITNRGLVDSCEVASETPTGHGYGQSALAMAGLFLMRPMSVDGMPVGGAKVSIPFNFMGGGGKPDTESIIHVLAAAPWATAPTADQVAAAYPKNAVGRVHAGHVILRCGLRKDGRLDDCESVSEQPEAEGFAHAAKSLIGDFQFITNSAKPVDYARLKIDMPFDFRDPSLPAMAVEIHNPVWIKRITPAGVASLYPAAALKAGYKTGSATVTCSVKHDGALTDCIVGAETPVGVGFGDAALKVAAVMGMNLWTSQGTPVDGMRITLPIRLEMPDDAPATPTPAPPTK